MKIYKNTIRKIISVSIIIGIIIVSNILVRNTKVSSYSIFNTANLFTYFGVLIGFAITVYTFGLSMVADIKEKIDKKEKFADDKKRTMYNSLINGFSQIKSDIWLIFYSIIIIIIFAIAKEITNPFGWDVEIYMIPESVNLALFITTTIGMWDIMYTLFNLAEINFELNKE
jgi:hypothetical protein